MIYTDARFNGLLWVRNYGQKKVLVERVNHGISIINDAVSTRHVRTANFKIVTSGSFTLDIAMMSQAEYEEMGRWLIAYGKKMSNPANSVSAMRVTVPQFHFDKTAIPTSGINLGARSETVIYRMSLAFVGASDPVGADVASKYLAPSSPDEATPHFYPGSQLKGDELTEEMYDAIEAERASTLQTLMERVHNPWGGKSTRSF